MKYKMTEREIEEQEEVNEEKREKDRDVKR